MEIIREESFDFNSKKYAVKVIRENSILKVRAFLNNKPANNFSFLYDLFEIVGIKDLEISIGKSIIDYLIDLAKKSVTNSLTKKIKE